MLFFMPSKDRLLFFFNIASVPKRIFIIIYVPIIYIYLLYFERSKEFRKNCEI